jgi:mRNA-degrading endonuclease RelE of RelBE toxin-antitoxin system
MFLVSDYSNGQVRRARFAVRYDPEVANQLRVIGRRWFGLIRRTIEEQLTYEPETETRNRKPLRRPSALAEAWELRFGPDNRFRVFYRVAAEEREVHVLAVGQKRGNRLYIGKEEFEL